MSLVSHGMIRLRRLWKTVYIRNIRLNMECFRYPSEIGCSVAANILEQLEPRLLLSGTTYLVNSLADVVAADGVVTLREAILAANTNTAYTTDVAAGSDTDVDLITFDQTALQTEAGAGNSLIITLGGTELSITDDLNIIGLGDDVLTITANSLSRVMNLNDGTDALIDVSISGLTITGGKTSLNGGGIYSVENLALMDSTVSNNQGGSNGGGISCTGNLDITNSSIINNILTAGSSSGTGGGGIYCSGELTITNTVISGNKTPTNSSSIGLGGGIYSTQHMTLTDSVISNNMSGCRGGGIVVNSATITGSEISGNSSASGGGISGMSITISDSIVSQNTAKSGGGIYGNTSSTTDISSSTISGNTATNGGGIYGFTVSVADSWITDNSISSTSTCYGGGILGQNITLANSVVANNTAAVGIGMYYSRGGGVAVRDIVLGADTKLEIVNATITGNSANYGGGVYFQSFMGKIPSLNNTLIALNEATSDASTSDYSGPLVAGSNNFIGTTDGDPFFVDSANENYTSLSGLCINAGDNALAVYPDDSQIISDIDGNDRIISETVDIGAFEFDPSLTYVQMDKNSLGLIANQSQQVQFRLAAQPDSDVTITLSGAQSGITPDKTSFTFTPLNWDQYQTLTFTAAADVVGGIVESFSLTENGQTIETISVGILNPLVVNTLADVTANDGVVSLREAIAAANSNTAANDTPAGSAIWDDYITFDMAALQAEAGEENPLVITLNGTELCITDGVSIVGLGDEILTINANNLSRIFNINNNSSNLLNISISGLALTNGLSMTNGGGIYTAENLTITDVTVTSCSAYYNYEEYNGGGIYAAAGTALIVVDSVITDNLGNDGGGIACDIVTITNSTISGNQAFYTDDRGGGISANVLTVSNSSIHDNNGSVGGGVFVYYEAAINNSTIYNNNGMGVCGYYNSTIAISYSTISSNLSGVYGYQDSVVTIVNSQILNNVGGPGVSGYDANLSIINSVVSGNKAGIVNEWGGSITTTNSTVAGNWGNGVDGYDIIINNSIISCNGGEDIYGDYLLKGSIVGSDPGFVRKPNDGGDGWTDNIYTTNIDESANNDYGDLHLIASSINVNSGTNSLAVDANGFVLSTDIEGNTRIYGGRVDAGAYEYQGLPSEGRESVSFVVTTSEDVIDFYDGQISLREAVWYASENGSAKDTITFDSSLNGTIIFLEGHEIQINSNVEIDASELAAGLIIDAQNTSRIFCVNDGTDAVLNVSMAGIAITGGATDSNGGGIYSVETLTITNSQIVDNSAGNMGGGICSIGVNSLVLINSVISSNSSYRYGGGVYADTLYMEDVVVSNNDSSLNYGDGISGGCYAEDFVLTLVDSEISYNAGVGIYGIIDNTGVIRNSIISHNTDMGISCIVNGILQITNSEISKNKNSGIRLEGDGSVYIRGCRILNNSSTGSGGGISASSFPLLSIVNSEIVGNYARYHGGGIFVYGSSSISAIILTNSVVTNNSALENGGGIYNYKFDLTLNNTVIWDNSAPEGIEIINTASSGQMTFRVQNSLIESSGVSNDAYVVVVYEGTNISTNPLFVRDPSDGGDGWRDDPTTTGIDESANNDYGDLRLQANSPAIDAGDNSLAVDESGNPLAADLEGNRRISDGDGDGVATVDIGAYEYTPASVVAGYVVKNTGGNIIDTTKQALLVGQAASASNFTNSSHGIGNMMFDVTHFANPAGLDASDFVFYVSDINDPDNWVEYTGNVNISVILGNGEYNSDRVSLVFDDGDIVDKWLRVKILPTADTGLSSDSDFAFGNIAGDASGDGKIDMADFSLWQQNYNPVGGNTSVADVNGDGKVDMSDFSIWQQKYNATGYNMPTLEAMETSPVGLETSLSKTVTKPSTTIPVTRTNLLYNSSIERTNNWFSSDEDDDLISLLKNTEDNLLVI